MLERLGAPVGSLGTAYLEAPTLYMCLACAEQVSQPWHVPYTGDGTAIAILINTVCARRIVAEPATSGQGMDEEQKSSQGNHRPGRTGSPSPGQPQTRRTRAIAPNPADNPAEPPLEDRPTEYETARLTNARRAVWKAACRTGVGVCFSCAEGVVVERQPGHARTEDRAFTQWAAMTQGDTAN